MASLSLNAINCVRLSSEKFVLRVDSKLECGAGMMWIHASGTAIAIGGFLSYKCLHAWCAVVELCRYWCGTSGMDWTEGAENPTH